MPQAQPQAQAKPTRAAAAAMGDASGVTRPESSDDYEFPPVSMIERSDQSTLDADFDDEIRETAERLQGYIHTVWSGAGQFLRRFNAVKAEAEPEDARFDDAHALQTVIATFTNLAQ